MIQPRPYQTAAISAVQDSWRRNDRVLVSMPTGTGKTICGSLLIGQWPNICGEYGRSNRVLWLAQRDELIWQAAEEIYAVTGEEPAVEKGEFRSTKSAELFHRRVVVSSVQTMAHRKERFGRDNFGMAVIDECQHSVAPQHMEVLNYFGRAKLLGITATTDRADEVSLGKVFQDVPYCYGIEDAIRDGYLCPIVSKFVEIKELDFGEIRSLVDIPLEQLDTILAAEGPLHRLVRPVFKESGKRQTIVFCPGVKTAHAVAALLDRYAGQEGSAFAVDGETPEEQRRDIIERYKRGEYQFLVNANLLLEGFNAPTIACVAMLRPTKSRMLYAQAVGRGLRGGRNAPVEGKDDCLILDMVGASYQHKLCTSINLLGGSIEECVAKNAWESIPRTTDNEKPEEKPATDLQAAMAAAIDQADDLRRQERQRILAEVRYNLKDTSPFDWLDIQERPMEGWWEAKPPTQEQLAVLKANGIQTKGLEYTQAKQLCDAIAKRLEEGYCTPRQARTLVAFGYSPTTPAGQAVKILAELKKRGFKHTTDEAIRFQQAKIERENREIATTAVAGEAVWGPRGGWLGFVVTLPRGGKKLIKNRDRARELARAMQRRGVRINGGKKPPTLGAQGTTAT